MINIEEEIKLLENAAENAVKEGEKEAVEKKRLDAENKRYTIWISVSLFIEFLLWGGQK